MTNGDEGGQMTADASPVPAGVWRDRADLYKRPDGSTDESKKRKVQRWVNDGWLHLRVGEEGQQQVLMADGDEGTPVWTAAAGPKVQTAATPASEQVVTIDPEIVRFAIRETGTMICSLPPVPDPAKEALERGEPDVVVAERVKARGMFWLGFWLCLGMVGAAFVAAAAYLRRHGLAPRSLGSRR
jgi:hypothetical protein